MRYVLWLLAVFGTPGLTGVPVEAVRSQRPASDTVDVAVLEDWPPHYQLDDGEPAGFAVDVMETVADRTGLAVRYTVFRSFPDAIDALAAGRTEVIPDMGITTSRQAEFAFTRPFEAFRISVFTRRSDPGESHAEALNGQRVGVVRSNAAAEILGREHPSARLVVFDNVREMLFELLAAGVDAAVYPEEVFLALARSAGVEHRIRALPEPVTEVPRGMAVAPSDSVLRARLDAGVEALVGTEEFEEIYRRWFQPPEPFWTVWRVVLLSGGLLLVVLAGMGAWRYVSVSRLGERLRRSRADQAEAEAARRKEEHRFQTLVEAAYEGIVVGDEDNRVVFANRRVCELIGVDEDELVGGTFLEYVAEEHHGRIREGIKRRREGVSGSYEIRLERPDGGEVWVLLSVAPILDDDGTFQGSVGTLADISELRHAEQELRASEAQFRQIAEGIDDVFWVTTPEKGLEYLSPAYETIWGRPAETAYEGIERRLESVHPEDRDRVRAALQDPTRDEFEEEYRIVRPDGEVRWIWDRAFSVRDSAGEVVRRVGVAEDITDRIAAEAQLKERERRFRAFVENATDLISTLTVDGRMMYQSPPVTRLLGYEPEELRGDSVFKYVHPDDRPEAESVWEELISEPGKTIRLYSFRFRHKDGSWRRFEATLTNLLDDPAVGAILSNARDVTERDELENRLRQSQKLEAVGQLAGGVAHDFNNLLTVIQANSEFLLEAHGSTNPLREHLREIRQATRQGADLTRQLLAFSRDQVLEPRPTDLNRVVTAMQRLLRRIIGEDITLIVNLDDGVVPIEVDPGQLEQVIMNLAVNARDAMPRGGTLEVRTTSTTLDEPDVERLDLDRPGTHTRLTVRDTGVGMDEATRKKVFDPFFTTKAQESGTGLGLATVHGVVRQSGGAIEVKSETGVGTTFHLYFPTTDRPVEPADAESRSAVVEKLEGDEQVLVVEDDGGVRQVLERTLRRYGYGVEAVENVARARALLEGSRAGFDLVLTDLVLPDASGLELVDYVREAHPETRLIAMSGYSRHEILEERVLGRDITFLAKPFTPEEVAMTVRDVLGARSR